MKLAAVVASMAALVGSAAAAPTPIGVTPFCSSIPTAGKSPSNCNRMLGYLCDEIQQCPWVADIQAQINALAAEIASIRAILPGAARYEGANGGTVSVGGGTVANVLTQVVAFPSANSTVAPKGVDQVSIFFTVTGAINPPATISWSDLTNGEYAGGATLVEGTGAVRCGVTMGYGGGSSAVHQQANLASTNGFVAYGFLSSNGLELQTDQLPVVNNFDSSVDIWPLGQYSCTFLVARP